MTESIGDELLAAIRANPDDRALRLVYADWLMERGDPRGEWIALSCGQATEDTDREMRRRALWQHHGKQWESEDRADSGLSRISYRDGFPDYARVGDRAHLRPRQLARHPIRTLAVDVVPGADAGAALFADGWLAVGRCTYERKLELSGRAVKVRAT